MDESVTGRVGEWTRHDMARNLGIPCSGAPTAYRAALQRDPCSYCGASNPGIDGELDHIQARSRGGPNHWSNYTNACGSCNPGKSDLPLLEFLLGIRDAREFGFPCSHRVTFGTRPTDEPQTVVYRRLRATHPSPPNDVLREIRHRWESSAKEKTR
jgi:hypothetical protein